MMTVFMNKKGDVLFTYPNVEVHQGDMVKFNVNIYLVVSRTFNVQGGFYEILLIESDETE